MRDTATEPTRDVVAVIYQSPGLMVKPAPYVLVAVGRDGVAMELPEDIESPYAIRGRK